LTSFRAKKAARKSSDVALRDFDRLLRRSISSLENNKKEKSSQLTKNRSCLSLARNLARILEHVLFFFEAFLGQYFEIDWKK